MSPTSPDQDGKDESEEGGISFGLTPNQLPQEEGLQQIDDEDEHFDELMDEDELEDALTQIDLRLESIKPHLASLKLDETRQIAFDERDPIFLLAKQNSNLTKTPECGSCQKVVFKKDKEIIYCQFCGVSNCGNCAYKERPFLKARIQADGKKPRGKICKLCDRKFFVKQLIHETSQISKKEEKNIKS